MQVLTSAKHWKSIVFGVTPSMTQLLENHTKYPSNLHLKKSSVPHAGTLSNQFMEDLNLIYKLKTILKLNNSFKINR